jgi:hypothetical protein
MSIRKTTLKNCKWSKEWDLLLTSIFKYFPPNKTPILIQAAGTKFSSFCFIALINFIFARPNNVVSVGTTTWILRGAWSIKEDLILISFVISKGKKWAFIAKEL